MREPSLQTRHHSTAIHSHAVPSVVSAAQESISAEVQAIRKLSETASKYPYYKFNYAWTRQIQDAVSYRPASVLRMTKLPVLTYCSASLSSYAATWEAWAHRRAANCSPSRTWAGLWTVSMTERGTGFRLTSLNTIHSPREPQRPRRLPPDDRGVPPRSRLADRGSCASTLPSNPTPLLSRLSCHLITHLFTRLVWHATP